MKQKNTPIPILSLTKEERLQFAVRFAQMDLDTLRAGAWLDLREDFLWFLNRLANHGHLNAGDVAVRFEGKSRELYQSAISHGFTGLVEDGPDPADLSEEDFDTLLRAVQRDVRTILDTFIAADPPSDAPFTPTVASCPQRIMTQRGLVAHGTLHELFNEHVFWLLGNESPDRILRCPECGVIFVRVQKQAYCSRKCGNRVTHRRWRERQDASTTTTE